MQPTRDNVFSCWALVARAADAQRSPTMRAERAKLKSCKDAARFSAMLEKERSKPHKRPVKQASCACLIRIDKKSPGVGIGFTPFRTAEVDNIPQVQPGRLGNQPPDHASDAKWVLGPARRVASETKAQSTRNPNNGPAIRLGQLRVLSLAANKRIVSGLPVSVCSTCVKL